MRFDLMDYFIERLYQVYGVTESPARHFYESWNLEKLNSKSEIDSFLNSDLLRNVVVSKDGLNLLKKYEAAELENLGTVLNQENENERIFKDTKFGYTWRQLYHGFSEVWLDQYVIIAPVIDDKIILEWLSRKGDG
jgi:hypothetical protein